MNDKAPNMIWTPSGPQSLDGSRRSRVELKPALIEWLVQFSDFAEYYKLGLHCSECGSDLIGKNSESDKVFSAVCNCREFVGGNRDYRPPS